MSHRQRPSWKTYAKLNIILALSICEGEMCKLCHLNKQNIISFTQTEDYTNTNWKWMAILSWNWPCMVRFLCPGNKDNITMLKVSQIHKQNNWRWLDFTYWSEWSIESTVWISYCIIFNGSEYQLGLKISPFLRSFFAFTPCPEELYLPCSIAIRVRWLYFLWVNTDL
jgi:hypothetical protein